MLKNVSGVVCIGKRMAVGHETESRISTDSGELHELIGHVGLLREQR
jgi:hypothetical protein